MNNSFEYEQKMNNYIKYILMWFLVLAASFAAHYLILLNGDASRYWEESGYSLLGLYSFVGGASFLIMVFVLLAKWSMPERLGVVFLGLMFIKAIASYVYIQNGLNKFENDFIEYNFLVVFFIFLFFDVFIAFKALNQEDKKV